jgi:hypothetical protein
MPRELLVKCGQEMVNRYIRDIKSRSMPVGSVYSCYRQFSRSLGGKCAVQIEKSASYINLKGERTADEFNPSRVFISLRAA